MEMFERDVQPVLDEYLKDIISEKNFRSEARAWDNYADYRPLIERAKDHHIPVIAANAPARYVNLVARKGLTALYRLDRSARQWIGPLPIDTLSGPYAQKFLEAMGGHVMPGMHLYESQNLWDATMAYSIKKALKRHRRATVLQLNGRFHSDDHTGLAERLRRLRRPLLTISCFRAEDFDQPSWDTYKTLADFVILTRAAAEPSHRP
ncbi:hypothetical protein GCM10023143_29760 [Compostibacter hankyongensis]|uniref:Haem-binding uptake Tiki superfamily ChaN domain-containing protein n=2 Tax=Compostibacter hankyongensis TaxID=1007089 RepID=A0ABP8G5T6_9BACT